MTKAEIEDVISRFVSTAKLAQQAGFDGVEIHAAHGYLLAQFLSPLTNKREDDYGGSLANRARLLLSITEAIRSQCGTNFVIGIKLNSADFQRGGFDVDDAAEVVDMLAPLAIDFIELSGGSYEAPAMQGRTADQRTLEREAYFLTFAERIANRTSIPVMTTGGINKLSTANKVIESGLDMVGMASALAYNPNLPHIWQQSNIDGFIPRVTWKDKALAGLSPMALIKRQLRRIGQGNRPSRSDSPVWSLILDQFRLTRLTKRYRRTFADEVDRFS